ncbi:MAG: hypothetical protein ACTS9Y_00890 [Methylophilus sp.]|uniref:hypothetical protein n=1 Tax=Methylophilus sp. TaxID=29541 RepID=UPI003F9F8B3B
MHFKDILTVNTSLNPDGIYEVHWQWCSKKQGIVRLDMRKVQVHPSARGMEDVIAELHGIHYVLEHKRFLGDSCGGINLSIKCSLGGTKKALNGKGNFKSLGGWCTFLRNRFEKAEVIVDQDDSFKHEKALQNISNIEYKKELYNRIKDFRGEWFVVTMHAMERVAERWNLGQNGEEAWRKIMLVFADEVTLEYVEVNPDGRVERYFFNELQNVLFACKEESIVSVVYTERKDIKWLKKNDYSKEAVVI